MTSDTPNPTREARGAVERVAKALCRRAGSSPDQWPLYVPDAEVAIAALPTREAECARALRDVVAEWLPIVERQLQNVVDLAPASQKADVLETLAYKTAAARVERTRAALSASPPPSGKFAGLSDEELKIIARWGGRDTDKATYSLYTEIADERRRRSAAPPSRATEPPR